MLHTCRKYNLGAGAPEFLKIIDKLVKLLRGMEIGFNQHRVLACYAAAFNYVGAGVDVRIESWLLVRFYLKVYESLYKIADSGYIYHSLVAS